MIAEFNRRIKINRYEFAQNSYGGNITLPVDSWQIWANVEETPGSKVLDNAQINYQKSFRIRVRAELSRPLLNTDEIEYLGDRLTIQSIARESEGRVNFLRIEAYTTNETELTPI